MELVELRAINKIRDSIGKLGLDLSGLTVLTEVGSNNYRYTPVIVSLAGAKNVFAWTRDTRYGRAKDIIESCRELLSMIELEDRVEFYIGDFNEEHLMNADIITNSGFLRPLDEKKLELLKKDAVIPLMYEKWELREADLDIEYALNHDIKVAGTWENHPSIMVFDHVGPLAIKMTMEAGYEVFRNKIIVWSSDHFGSVTKKSFEEIGAREVILTTSYSEVENHIHDTDFIFIADYSEDRKFGDVDFFNVDRLLNENPHFGIIHLFGKLSYSELSSKIPIIYPKKDGMGSVMTFTLSHLGLNPIIDLQVAGLRVGQALITGEAHDLKQEF